MKKKSGFPVYLLIIAIIFVLFIMIISNGTNTDNGNYININKLRLSDIFSFRKKLNLDEFDTNLTIELNEDGYDIYTPNKAGYRYGPSIINYDDGSKDAWFASNGNSKEWDWIRYRHFDGSEWSDEEIVLRPTVDSLDHYSTCDPGVIYFNGYYYLGYTSTDNSTNGGVENCGFIARSKNPNGPFEKWNGDGWGGDPKPIIVYDEQDLQWGAGEFSFVIVNDKLYVYYSWISSEGNYTKLALADLVDDWPLTMTDKGIVIEKVNGQDSIDVVYVDEYEKFLAFCVESRFMNNSCIAVYESNDGVSFEQVDRIENINKFSHNMGISKNIDGHVKYDDDLIVGYAYGKSAFNTWGKWSTRIQSAKLKVLKEED